MKNRISLVWSQITWYSLPFPVQTLHFRSACSAFWFLQNIGRDLRSVTGIDITNYWIMLVSSGAGIGLTDVWPNNCRQYRKHHIYHDMITSWSPQNRFSRSFIVYLILFSFICVEQNIKWFNITDTERLLCQAGTATANIPSSLSLSLSPLYFL